MRVADGLTVADGGREVARLVELAVDFLEVGFLEDLVAVGFLDDFVAVGFLDDFDERVEVGLVAVGLLVDAFAAVAEDDFVLADGADEGLRVLVVAFADVDSVEVAEVAE